MREGGREGRDGEGGRGGGEEGEREIRAIITPLKHVHRPEEALIY